MGCSSGKAGPPSKGASSDPKGKGSATAATDLPLRGIRVVDFGQFVAGPMCGKMLLDQGADVIHIGPPRPSWNSQANSVLNMGKHLVTLDLKDAKDVQKARDLYISKADILIENFPPGRMDKFGLGADAMLKAYPGLIYVSMPGFASGDEEFQDVKAHEHVIMARAGVFWDMGLSRSLRGVNPSYSPLPLASSYGGILAGAAAVAALYAREDTGIGDHIEIPLASALLDALCFNTLDVDDLPRRYWGKRTEELFRRRRDGIPMDMTFEQVEDMLDPFFKTYYCKDGRPFYIVGMGHMKHVARTLQVLNCEKEVLEILPFGDLWAREQQTYQGDSVLGQYHLREPYSKQIIDIFKERFKAKTAFEWEQEFGAIRVPTSATRTTQEWVNSDHARASGLMRPAPSRPVGTGTEDGAMGTGFGKEMLVPGPLVWLSGSSAKAGKHQTSATSFASKRPVPQSAAPLKAAPAEGTGTGRGYMQGVKILDLSNVIACPMAGVLCARFGAEVIKIDLPHPSYGPVIMVGFGVLAMRGKKSTLLDLSTPDGFHAFARLVRRSDIVTFNGVDPQLEALGITLEALQKINPSIILFHLNSFGGPNIGPRTNYIGYDDLTQSTTGIMARFGGSLETAEEHAHIGTVDVVTGFAGAFAIFLALFQRKRTGSAEKAQTSLASVGQMVQVPYCFDGALRGEWNEPKGVCVGEHFLYHSYKCRDDVWGFLAATGQHPWPEQLAEGKDAMVSLGIPCEDVSSLTQYFATLSFEEHQAVFRNKGITFVRIGSFSDLDRKPQPKHKTFHFVKTLADHNPSGRDVTYFGNSVRSRNWEVCELPELPKYGKDTRAVLQDVAELPPAKVDCMLAGGKSAAESLGAAFPDSSGVWELSGFQAARGPRASRLERPGGFWCASAACASHASAPPGDVAEKLAEKLGGARKLQQASLLLVFAAEKTSAESVKTIARTLAAKAQADGSALAVHGGRSQSGVATEAGIGYEGVVAFVVADPQGRYSSGEGRVPPKTDGEGHAQASRSAGAAAATAALQRVGLTAEQLESDPPAFALFSAAAAGAEEEVLLGVQDVLGETLIFGGTSGGDIAGQDFVITAGLEVVPDTVCVTLAWPTVPIFTKLSAMHSDIIAEGKVTKVSNGGRTIETIDDQPAFDRYKIWSEASGRSEVKPGTDLFLEPETALYPMAEPHTDASGARCYKMLLARTGTAGGSLELFTAMQEGDHIVMMKATREGLASGVERLVADVADSGPLAQGVLGGLVMFSAGVARALGEEAMSEAMSKVVLGLKGCPIAGQLTLGQVGPAGYRDRTTGEPDGSDNGPNRHGNLMLNVLLFGAPAPSSDAAAGGLTGAVSNAAKGIADKATGLVDQAAGLADKAAGLAKKPKKAKVAKDKK